MTLARRHDRAKAARLSGELQNQPEADLDWLNLKLGVALRGRGHRSRAGVVTDQAIALLAPWIGTRAACAASGVAQASWYRRHRASPAPPRRLPVPHRDRAQPRALAPAERAAILAALHAAAVRRHRPRRGLGHPARRGHRPLADRPPSTGCSGRRARSANGARRPPRPRSNPSSSPPEPNSWCGAGT